MNINIAGTAEEQNLYGEAILFIVGVLSTTLVVAIYLQEPVARWFHSFIG